jgi:nicotinamidase-related amidase
MGLELEPGDAWVLRGYGQARIEPGERPAVLVVDLQYAFTDPSFCFGGAELIERATVNCARLLGAARAAGVPVFHTVVEWRDERELGLWGIKLPPWAGAGRVGLSKPTLFPHAPGPPRAGFADTPWRTLPVCR